MLLQPAETVKIFQKHPSRLVSAGQIIFEQGQPGDYMYGILEGEIELSIDGKVVETLKAGDVFGEGALSHPNGYRFTTAIAKTDCKLAQLDQQHFLFVIQETPMFALQVIRSYSDRLRELKAHWVE
ncbi:cyclic nucleotide-binding domain-containing protein [Egbenema bharatensis]|uniref:cyclic nucleotide-binding domain-containing protein n=1 Tax=Egbenema bharatensis TaxID=3463334 RepID=UPI003A8366F4